MPFLLVLTLVAVAAFVSWRLMQTSLNEQSPSGSRRPAPRGPDDDPDFLRSLDRR
ncbi:hypothetical protein [Gordonia sp. (in: high G+C Gram-positive bacteria)]|uniref:hypothetical protein n=1 Tax=Gordonia sp. (in: high G+C Gram-positive bacteria) TaxID=84139 RepID=UPI0016AEF0AC|nr:hypothetical protein [Gordonia sp. (in: high G+C Gram-positive bacteria)]NLG45530.1 hypothetical protein [Gordonia sp. (in: high G+C Gram-positive bacteria)]